MPYEAGLLVGGVSIVTVCVAKLKCYVKKNGVWNFGCGFLDKPLVIKYGGHDDQLSTKYWGMDRFRIKSLEKNLKNNWFTTKQKKSVLNILTKKLSIVSNGAKKRNNEVRYRKYRDKLNYWLLELDKVKNE